jgi:hypothetical protein
MEQSDLSPDSVSLHPGELPSRRYQFVSTGNFASTKSNILNAENGGYTRLAITAKWRLEVIPRLYSGNVYGGNDS